MKQTLAAAAFCLLTAAPAVATEVQHTASWYAAHPVELAAKVRVCLDDPGHAKYVPNCENATQAQFIRSANDARAHSRGVDAADADRDDTLWRARPDVLLNKLKICNSAPLEFVRASSDCMHAFHVAQDLRR